MQTNQILSPAVLSFFVDTDTEEQIEKKLEIILKLDEETIKDFLTSLNKINIIKINKVEHLIRKYLLINPDYSAAFVHLQLVELYLNHKQLYKDNDIERIKNTIDRISETINEQLIKIIIYILYDDENYLIRTLIYKLYFDDTDNKEIYLTKNKNKNFYSIGYIEKFINGGYDDLTAINFFYDKQEQKDIFISDCVICFDTFKFRNLKKSFLDCCINAKGEAGPKICGDCVYKIDKCPYCKKGNIKINKDVHNIIIRDEQNNIILNGENKLIEDEIIILNIETKEKKEYTIYTEKEFKIKTLNNTIENLINYCISDFTFNLFDTFKKDELVMSDGLYHYFINLVYNNEEEDGKRNFINDVLYIEEDNEEHAETLYNLILNNGLEEEIMGDGNIKYEYEYDELTDDRNGQDLIIYLVE